MRCREAVGTEWLAPLSLQKPCREERIEKRSGEVTEVSRGYGETLFHVGKMGAGAICKERTVVCGSEIPPSCARMKVAGGVLILFTQLKGYAHLG